MRVLYNYLNIKKKVDNLSKNVKLVIVTKNYSIDQIDPIIKAGHEDFGENRVQEALDKWSHTLSIRKNIKLHLIGSLQSNKVKQAFKLFTFIHSLDSIKLAKIFFDLEKNEKKKINYFIQVNVADEKQKSGVTINKLDELVNYCTKELNLNVLGFMCIPPYNLDPVEFFKILKDLNLKYGFKNLSMGMSADFESAIKYGSNFVRIGSAIFN